jgi:hypothetical protein
VPVPHYYKGELVGEHRRYDERLTQFLLRYRDPLRYAKSLETRMNMTAAMSCSPSGSRGWSRGLDGRRRPGAARP